MSILKEYEKKVLYLLTSSVLSPRQLELAITEGEFISYDYTGCGYFLSMSHASLPLERVVCSQPNVIGRRGGVTCGFVIFIEGRQLTIECHSWGDESIPEWFRGSEVEVNAT